MRNLLCGRFSRAMDFVTSFVSKFSELTTAQISEILKQEEKANKEINAQITAEKRTKKEVVILILGAYLRLELYLTDREPGPGESGKSTYVPLDC